MSTLTVKNLQGVAPTNRVTIPAGQTLYAPGHVLQVQSTTKTSVFSTSSTTDVLITGLTVNITPISTSSKIFIMVNIGVSGCSSADYGSFFNVYRNSSLVTGVVGDTLGSRRRCAVGMRHSNAARYGPLGFSFLDSPSLSSTLTYDVYMAMESGGGTAYMNATGAYSSDAITFPVTGSTITVMEIAQ